MTAEDLFECIGRIDDGLIQASEGVLRSAKIGRRIAKIGSIAAAVLVVVLIAPFAAINLVGAGAAAPNVLNEYTGDGQKGTTATGTQIGDEDTGAAGAAPNGAGASGTDLPADSETCETEDACETKEESHESTE